MGNLTSSEILYGVVELQSLTVWIKTFTLHLISKLSHFALSPQLGPCCLYLTSLHSDKNYTPMVRLPKVLYIPLLGTSVCKMFSDRIGTGVKNLGCCHQETPFLFNSSELLCVQHSARHFSGEQRRGQEGYKTNFQPTESFHIRNRTLFHINKAL